MLNRFKLLIVILSAYLFFPAFQAGAANSADVYFFYGDGCPHCANEEILLDKMEKENKYARIHRYEVWNNRSNQEFLTKLGERYGWNIQGVPFTVVGEKTFSGYLNEETTGKQIISAVKECEESGCPDIVDNFLKNKGEKASTANNKSVDKINLPVLGSVETKKISLPLLTIAIAAVDGINPCALWVLLFLISLLVGMQERKKLLILGGLFILSSAVFYFLVLSAWLNFIKFIGFIFWLRILIGMVALYSGYYYLKKWIDRDKACKSVDEEKRKKIFGRLKDIVAREKIYLAMGGIIILGVSVNLFKLVCSAGLPAVYTQILAISDLPKWQYFAYIALYVLVFEIYEIIILGMALATFKMKAINPKFIEWVNLAGGIIMFLIGALLIFKPGWLMFG